MKVEITSETVKPFLKKAAYVVFVSGWLFATAMTIEYYRWRKLADPIFAVMEFDLRSRSEEINKKLAAARQQEEAAKAAAKSAAGKITQEGEN